VSDDNTFYGEGMEPQRLGALVVPARRVLRRLQRPWFERQVQILDALRRDLDVERARGAVLEREVQALRHEVAELRAEVAAQEARAWDQTAIANRLAALEDSSAAAGEAGGAR
jgi:hypothetical protein